MGANLVLGAIAGLGAAAIVTAIILFVWVKNGSQ